MNSARSFAVRSMSLRQTVSTGVCMERTGMPRRPQGTPDLLTWMAQASVPLAPAITSVWWGISSAAAAAASLSRSTGWKLGPMAMLGPPSIFTVSFGERPGCIPKVTSTATAIVGSMPYAPVTAPGHGGLLLDRGHGEDVPGVPAPGQLFQAQRDGRNGGPVVHGLAGRVPAGKRHEAAAQRHDIADVHRRLHVLTGKPDVDEELFQGDGLLPLRRVREMRGHAHHQAGQLAGAVNHHLLAEEDPRVETADLRDLEEAFFDLGHHERDLVHVPGEHDGGPVSRGAFSPAQGNEVPHGVHPHLVRELAEALPHYLADLGLVP